MEIAKKGGKASVKAKREKKAIQTILNEYMNAACESVPPIFELAQKLGIDGKTSIKQLFTLVSTLNSLKKANLSELEKLSSLLGEQIEQETEEESKQAKLLNAIEKAVQNAD